MKRFLISILFMLYGILLLISTSNTAAAAYCARCTTTACTIVNANGFTNCKVIPGDGTLCSGNCGGGGGPKPSIASGVLGASQDSANLGFSTPGSKIECTSPEIDTRDVEFWSHLTLGSNDQLFRAVGGDATLAQGIARLRHFQIDPDAGNAAAFGAPLVSGSEELKLWLRGAPLVNKTGPNETGMYGEFHLEAPASGMKTIHLNVWEVLEGTQLPVSGISSVITFKKDKDKWVIFNISKKNGIAERRFGSWGL
jgi:hypothetical protein